MLTIPAAALVADAFYEVTALQPFDRPVDGWLAGAVTSAVVDASSDVLALLADPARRRIVSLLAVEQLCTCHLVEELGMKQPVVSHHLKALREAGVVEGSPCGRFTYYRLRPGALDGPAADLADLAAAARHEPARRPC